MTVVLDTATRKPVDVGAKGVWLTHFLGAEKMLGTRLKPKGAADEKESVFFDLKAKKESPVPLPKEVTGVAASIDQVLPSPAGTRLLYVWSEEVPAPAGNWPAGVPCHATRMTISDLSGGHARTVYQPELKTRLDEVRNHVASIDWR